MKRGSAWPSLFVVLLAACEAPDDTALGGSPPAEVRITEATRVELAKHAPGTLPAPPLDVSNRYADDPAAAALGQRFFFDTGFSGALLDPDNDGNTPQALGEVGDTGRVGCVSCHVPDAAFVDNRSTRQQVSLAAGWGVRRTKSLLDIGQARILMWDGRRDALYNQPFQPIETATEMNSSRLFVAQEIHRRYRAEYEAVFGPIPIPLDDTGR
ncbi:MAG: cytochrome-c peroxidase, partial [Myxococcales bacterium]|nr:cytochrome-c peroxidase [Myxococcales bacterium]